MTFRNIFDSFFHFLASLVLLIHWTIALILEKHLQFGELLLRTNCTRKNTFAEKKRKNYFISCLLFFFVYIRPSLKFTFAKKTLHKFMSPPWAKFFGTSAHMSLFFSPFFGIVIFSPLKNSGPRNPVFCVFSWNNLLSRNVSELFFMRTSKTATIG